MLEYTFKIEIKAPRERVWEMYADFSKRRLWETDLEYIRLDRALATGAMGVMKLAGQPEMPYQITLVVLFSAYWDRTEIPGTKTAICFGHDFIASGEDKTILKITASLEKADGEINEEDILLLKGIFSDTPQAVLTIKKMVEA